MGAWCGSTPRALARYGIPESEYSDEATMFDLVHAMRTRIMTSPSFDGDRIYGLGEPEELAGHAAGQSDFDSGGRRQREAPAVGLARSTVVRLGPEMLLPGVERERMGPVAGSRLRLRFPLDEGERACRQATGQEQQPVLPRREVDPGLAALLARHQRPPLRLLEPEREGRARPEGTHPVAAGSLDVEAVGDRLGRAERDARRDPLRPGPLRGREHGGRVG